MATNEFIVRKGLIVNGSGSTVLDIQGSQGQLFSVTDDLTGTLFSVNDISGIPILSVDSDDTVTMGTFGANTLVVTGSRVGIGAENTTSRKVRISGGSEVPLLLDATQDYLLGFARSGTDQWWVKATTGGDLIIHENGVGDKVTFQAGGNVGIGTTTPAYELDVRGSSADSRIYLDDGASGAEIYLRSNGSGEAGLYISSNSRITRAGGDLNIIANAIDMNLSTNNGSTNHLRIDTSGDVTVAQDLFVNDYARIDALRVGTTSTDPGDGNLYVEGSTTTTGPVTINQNADALILKKTSDSRNSIVFQNSSGTDLGEVSVHDTANNSRFYVYDNVLGGYHFYSNSNGGDFVIPNRNVGIGTTDTSGLKMLIKGATGYPATSGTTQTGVLRISGGTGLYNVLDMGVNESTDVAWMQATRANTLAVYDKLAINPYGGNVGIGTTSPTVNKLQVEGSTDGLGIAIKNTGTGGRTYGIQSTGGTSGYGQGKLAFVDESVGARMVIDSSGNVGIGTTSPNYKLDVGDGTVNTSIRIHAGVNGSASLRLKNDAQDWDVNTQTTDTFAIYNQTSGTQPFSILTNGNVGISTTSPGVKLDVVGIASVGDVSNQTTRNNDGTFGLNVIQSGTDALRLVNSGDFKTDFVLNTGSNRLDIRDTDNSNLVVMSLMMDSTGNVGIGTTSPTEKLEVTGNAILDASNANLKIKAGVTGTKGDIQWTFNTDSTVYASAGIEYDNRGTDGFLIDSGYPITMDFASSYIRWQNNGSEKMRLNTSGNLGIGTTNPGSKLHVVQTSAAEGLRIDGASSGFALIVQGGTSYKTSMRNASVGNNYGGNTPPTNGLIVEGNVGIGTTSPDTLLHLSNALSPHLKIQDTTNDVKLSLYAQDANAFVGTTSTHNLNIGTANTAAININNSQNVTVNNDLFVNDYARIDALRVGTTSTDPGDGNLYVEGSATVLGDLSVSNAQPKLRLFETDTTNQNKEILVSGGALYVRNLNDDGSAGSNLVAVQNDGDVEIKGNNLYFDGSLYTAIRSDNVIQVLTDGGGAQLARFKGIQVSTSYSGTPPTSGILFETDTNLFRSAANTLRTNDSLVVDDTLGYHTFNSGFGGSGWRVDSSANAEFQNLTVRGTFSVYELLAQQVRATNGSLLVATSGKVDTASGTSSGTLTFDTGSSYGHGFLAGDILLAQRLDPSGTSLKRTFVRVDTRVNAGSLTYTKLDGDNAEAGQEFVRIGHTSNADRQGHIYLTADDSNAPYIGVRAGLSSSVQFTSGTGSIERTRLGRLDGITSSTFGSLSGYGFWAAGNAYLEGTINATAGKIADLTITSNKIHTGAGNHNNADTGFYIDNSSNFSLGNKLSWNGSNLSVEGSITITGGDLAGVSSDSISGSFTSTSASIATDVSASQASIDNYETQVVLNSNGMELKDTNNLTLASYGVSTTIGPDANDKSRIFIDNNSVDLIVDSGGTDTTFASFGATTTVGNTAAEHISIDSDSVDIIQDANNKAVVSATGLAITQGGGNVASFGANTTITGGSITLNGASTNDQVLINNTGMTVKSGNVIRLTALDSGVIAYGDNANTYTQVSSGGLTIVDNSVTTGTFTSTGITLNGASTSDQVVIDSTGMTVKSNNVTRLTALDTGVIAYGDASDTYSQISSTGLNVVLDGTSVSSFGSSARVGIETAEHVLIDSSGFTVKDNNTTLATFGTDITLGEVGSSKRNVFIDADSGVTIRNNTTALANFGTDITLGQVGTNLRNVFIDADSGISIRNNTTVLAAFGDEMIVGLDAADKTALRVDNSGNLTIGTSGTTNFTAAANGNVTLTGDLTATNITATTAGNIAGFTISSNQITASSGILNLKANGRITGSAVSFTGGRIAGFDFTSTAFQSRQFDSNQNRAFQIYTGFGTTEAFISGAGDTSIGANSIDAFGFFNDPYNYWQRVSQDFDLNDQQYFRVGDSTEWIFWNDTAFDVNLDGATLGTLTLDNLSDQGSELTALTINGSNVVGFSELGTNAFTSTNIAVSSYSNATDNRVLTSTGAGGINGESNLLYDGSTLYVSGDVGIGVTSPSSKLTVRNATGGAESWTGGIRVENTSTTTGEAAVAFSNAGGSGTGANQWIVGLNQSANFDIAYGTQFTNGNTAIRVGTNKNVGIGGVFTTARLDIVQSGDTFGGGIRLRESDDTNDYWDIFLGGSDRLFFRYTSTSNGGYLNSTSDVAAIDFTGQHRSTISDTNDNISTVPAEERIGLIVVADGTYTNLDGTISPTINEALPNVHLASIQKDKKVYGVISEEEDLTDGYRAYSIGNFVSTYSISGSEDQRLIINSLGEGGIWVSNYSGSFENGDYITTSPIPGIGMKQADDLLHNYTVAKITQDCYFNDDTKYVEVAFSGSTFRKQFVGCTYHCG